jgi:hypothetical protein
MVEQNYYVLGVLSGKQIITMSLTFGLLLNMHPTLTL